VCSSDLIKAVKFCDFPPQSLPFGKGVVMLLAVVLFCKITKMKHIDAGSCHSSGAR
jgi:hypothetical protein